MLAVIVLRKAIKLSSFLHFCRCTFSSPFCHSANNCKVRQVQVSFIIRCYWELRCNTMLAARLVPADGRRVDVTVQGHAGLRRKVPQQHHTEKKTHGAARTTTNQFIENITSTSQIPDVIDRCTVAGYKRRPFALSQKGGNSTRGGNPVKQTMGWTQQRGVNTILIFLSFSPLSI